MRRSAVIGILLATAALLGAACVPPGPTGPKWAATTRDWVDAGSGPGFTFAATNDQWWANVQPAEDFGTATLHLHRRSGARGAPRATPTSSFPLPAGAVSIAMSDHLVAVRARTPDAGQLPIELFELDGDAWAPAGTVLRPVAGGSTFAMDLTDEQLAIAEQGSLTPPLTDGRVAVVPIDRTGPGVTTGAPTVLQPDPTWYEEARARFGAEVSMVGDLLAVSTNWDRLALYRHGDSGWAVLDVLEGGNPFGDGNFARAISLDRSGSPRIAVGSAGGWVFGVPQPGRVEIYQLSGDTWTVTHTIGPRDGSGLNGLSMGSHVALDGDLLVVSGHWQVVPRPDEQGGGTIADLRLEVHDLTKAMTFRDELSVYDAVGGLASWPSATQVGALELDLAGTHLAVSGYLGFGADPARFAAISFDRR